MEKARGDMREGAARIGVGDMDRALDPRLGPRDDGDGARLDRGGDKILAVELFADESRDVDVSDLTPLLWRNGEAE